MKPEEPGHPIVARAKRQRQESLALGNSTRSSIRRLKELMKSGELDGIQAILGWCEEWEPTLERFKLSEYLMAQPRFGVYTRDQILAELKLSGTTRIMDLTTNQRAEIAALIRIIKGV